MSLIPVESITADDLRSTKLAGLLPELYDLGDVVEIQAWHDHQDVLDHSLKSLDAFNKIIDFSYLSPDSRKPLAQYLNKKIGLHTREALLRIAVTFHDIGKLVSLQHNANGQTSCPSHGVIGSWVGTSIMEKIDMTPEEGRYVLDLISDHLLPSDLIELAIKNEWKSDRVANFLLKHRGETAIELVLLAYADWLGCDIQSSVKEEREERISLAHSTLSFLAQKNTP